MVEYLNIESNIRGLLTRSLFRRDTKLCRTMVYMWCMTSHSGEIRNKRFHWWGWRISDLKISGA